MASIFTYDPNPPRISSPWSTPRASTPRDRSSSQSPAAVSQTFVARVTSRSVEVTEHNEIDPTMMKLEAEPQEGPTEYKLHLLLRPRRSFIRGSTGRYVPGSSRERTESLDPLAATTRRASDSASTNGPEMILPASIVASLQARQHRLEQLTTQLLWRLQQSSPYHSSAANNLILPQLPEVSSPRLIPATRPCNLLPGLEESKGALYEIGVSDDGTLVGLAEDELEESLMNLQAMAASLGCVVQVLRKATVGDCRWYEPVRTERETHRELRTGKLWVAEAHVKPAGTPSKVTANAENSTDTPAHATDATTNSGQNYGHSPREQFRVSLTGSTMSGKSSLLGSLSTSTLDNGRGKSRLSLLKHRHEIASGMTSSVTQELVGYQTVHSHDTADIEPVRVVNYASDNVSAWTDIHERSENGRLVFLSDSAGHPRYRRTTLRGLVGWAPHWTLLCIPADNFENTSGKSGSTPPPQEFLGTAITDVDLSQAHLDLCLRLGLPLVVVITKLDLASKQGLRQTLSKLLSTLKAAGKRPSIIPDASSTLSGESLQSISHKDIEAVRKVVVAFEKDNFTTVPILLTSAVKGTGIGKLHALLRELPIAPPPVRSLHDQISIGAGSSPLFSIEDVYNKVVSGNLVSASPTTLSSVVSGYLRCGTLRVGDELFLGPFATNQAEDHSPDNSDSLSPPRRNAHKQMFNDVHSSRSFPGALHRSAILRSPRDPPVTWRRVRIVSLRNLRLPVQILRQDQVGTIGIEPVSSEEPINNVALSSVRKGMVLTGARGGAAPIPRRVFDVAFKSQVSGMSIGTVVVVYIASVRASAKVVAISSTPALNSGTSRKSQEDDDDGFGFGFESDDNQEEQEPASVSSSTHAVQISFQFLASREYVESGSQVLVMPGGGPGLAGGIERGEKGVAGLEGFVGNIC